MSTKAPLPHVVKAASLAHDIFAPKEDAPPRGELYKNVTVSVPVGLLMAVDLLARRAGRSRSATMATLTDCGYGLIAEQLTPRQRQALHEELAAALPPDSAEVTAPADGSATFDAVES
jgi:hypothetical protein